MSLAATAIVKLLPEVLDAEVSVEQTCKLSAANVLPLLSRHYCETVLVMCDPHIGESFNESSNDHNRPTWQTCFFNQ